MKLSISTLVEGENNFHYDSQKDGWVKEVIRQLEGQGYKLTTALNLDMKFIKVDPDFYLKGSIVFDVEQLCARCAETFPLKVKHPFDIALAKVPNAKLRTPELSEESEVLDINFFEGNEIDLNPIVAEQFFLSIPYQSLCKTDCMGMCQQCGANLNIKTCQCAEKSSVTPFSVLQEMKQFKQE